jgi:cell wall-associated NlpC family hydrolase
MRLNAKRRRAGAAIGVALALTLTSLPALADPNDDDPAVQAARQAERLAAASVAEIEQMIGALAERTEAAQIAASIAAETYNQAQVEAEAATAAANAAKQEAAQAEDDLASARGSLARVAMAASQSSTSVSALEPFLSSDGFAEAASRSELLSLAGTTADRTSRRYAIAKQASESAKTRAVQTEEIRQERAAAAEEAAAAAEAAADAAQAEQVAAEAEHTRLLQVLADKKQSTLEAEREAEARRIAEANRRAEEERRRQEQAAMRPPPAPVTPPAGGGSGGGGGGTSTPPSGGTTTPPAGGSGVSSGAAGQAAVEWARAQIGKPYQWGGNGPGSFDCSGLTQQAWRNGGGKYIPRVAADQYYSATKVAYSDMRPGDLIFWRDSSGYVYHVAIYSGGGKMIEAPRTGDVVKEIPIRWTNTHSWAGRY